MSVFYEPDPCPAIFLICLLLGVGQFCVAHSPRLQQWGLRLAFAAGLVYFGVRCYEDTPNDSGEAVVLTLRSLAIGALLLGPLWVLLGSASFLTEHVQSVTAAATARAAARRYERERKRQEATEQERQRLANLEWERQRPQRELEARLAAERAAADKRLSQSDQARRENARAACELLYAQFAPEIGGRFPQTEVDRFLRTYMSDAQSVDEVERRGQELQRLIHEHRQHIQRDPPETIQALAEWYLGEKERIEALPLDDDLKQTHLMQLDYRYAELSEQLLQRARP